jgi:pyruvate dehydrogenase kinase 2/3/4
MMDAAMGISSGHGGSASRPSSPMRVLDSWVDRKVRPISLRQLMFFARVLTEERLLDSANYVRTELPIRLAHRIRDMQLLPYAFVTNPHIRAVYDMYYDAFERLARIRPIRSLEDNDVFCETVTGMLKSHLTVIPKLAIGVLQSAGEVDAAELDRFMNSILRSRISRRVIAEQHLALTKAFRSPPTASSSSTAPLTPDTTRIPDGGGEYIGHVFIKCVAKDVIERVAAQVWALARTTYGPDVLLPELKFDGDLGTSFPYILGHLEYIVGELLRNSVRALVEKQHRLGLQNTTPPPPIEVTICASVQTVVIRICDRGGGVPAEAAPYLWSFSKGPHSDELRENLAKVPKMAATLQEVQYGSSSSSSSDNDARAEPTPTALATYKGSLDSLTRRPPDLQLGVSLPMSRVYAEYWAGSLQLHSLQGYGVDAFLQISRLGNKNEQLSTRETMDGV